MSIKEVVMYQTSDKQYFATREEAKAHNYVLQNPDLLNELIKMGIMCNKHPLHKVIEIIYMYIKEHSYEPR